MFHWFTLTFALALAGAQNKSASIRARFSGRSSFSKKEGVH